MSKSVASPARPLAAALALLAGACTGGSVDRAASPGDPEVPLADHPGSIRADAELPVGREGLWDGGPGDETAARGGGKPNEQAAADARSPGGDAHAPPVDASPPRPTGAGCGGLALCDGFESAPLGGVPDERIWKVVSPDCSGRGSLTIDDAQHHGGSRSVKVVGPNGVCNHIFMSNASAVAALGGQIFVRFFARFGSPMGDGHVTFVAMKDGGDQNRDLRFGGQGKVLVWNRQSDDALLPALSPSGIAASVAPPAERWVCIELMLDRTSGVLRTWVDEAPVAGLSIEGGPARPEIGGQWLRRTSWHPQPLDLRLGFEGYNGANVVWYDDVAIGGERIGCR